MILKAIQFELNGYGPNKGQYTGKVAFTDDSGEAVLMLTPKHCKQIFAILTCAIIEHKKAIESHDHP